MVLTSLLLTVVSVVSLGALVVTIVALAVPVWDTASVDVTVTRTVRQHTYTGLWSYCTWEEVKDFSSYTCDRIDGGETDALRAVQAMTLIGSVMCAGAVILVFLKCCLFKDSKILGIAIVIMCISAGVFLVIGAGVFAGEVYVPDVQDLHAGFALTFIAAGLIVAAGMIMICVLICTD